MKVIDLTYPLSSIFKPEPSCMAIGYFDGVHYGHQEVIGDAVRYDRETGNLSSVMTFDPHPKHLFGNSEYAAYITPLPQKLEIFNSLGVDIAYIVSFSLHFSRITPERFVEDFLSDLCVKSVTVGFDFSFGYRGSANPLDLQRLANHQFRVNVISSINSKVEKISSTSIRKALQAGNIEKANHYLSRKYTICGRLAEDLRSFQILSPAIPQ